ncbi:orotidine-5'-phosphate decarboxylase [Pelobacter propionicus]|uniref:Orotidine 5'-phosphate decarboxylase n=1 Tax=Pelobacter propionicus (strain DSM 2379 / NBRC 103807 / OttBd1) TaxID=338966 RepID=PYRF_PELPD|nr:orotidine-5'-phosphate decarboxylase [Pelobacter propionicus]A1APM0.1 RecName: Full=Orotidine 5'-phosphate decarboxylase; AltName: Full=OMP decarboxylase; Short=OMPDCase; Short=OMPdecase [Pelobacter propionicus DSM 2379]ABK99290.1 orotidine-5'-phosphate decarboxylase [Pelobacter propionicus DSM 2379]
MNRDEARKKIIFALDVNGIAEIDRYAGLLSDRVGMFKIGKELFTACGPEAVATVRRHGGQVFLDLKYHDIPNTVAKAMLEAARLGVQLANLHALGGLEMMETAASAVRREFGDDRPRLLAVTILTSSTAETLRRVGIDHPVEEMVVRLACLAREAGMDGVVASPREIGLIRQACGPDFLIVTPGVRPSFASQDDQKRIMSPDDAVREGADYLVIGRPIAKADDPVRAVDMIVDEIVAGCP